MAELELDDPLGLTGKTLADTYQLLNPIGQGGFGAVFRAKHLMLNRLVAVKVQKSALEHRDELVERFRREAEASWRLRHAGAVEVYDCRVDRATGRFFIAMELLRGRSLGVHWLINKTLPADEAVRYVVHAAQCLAVAHRHGIVHRDLKPENIFLCDEGSVRVLDFGSVLMLNASRLTRPGQYLGTTSYMPEEQILRPTSELDGRVDIYALGVVLYQLISGRMMHAHAEDLRVMRGRILREDPPDIRQVAPSTSDELARVIRRAIARDRESRHSTMEDFIGELLRASPTSQAAAAATELNARSIGTVITDDVGQRPTIKSEAPISLLQACAEQNSATAKTSEQNAPKHITRPGLADHSHSLPSSGASAKVYSKAGRQEPPTVPLLRQAPPVATSSSAWPETSLPHSTQPIPRAVGKYWLTALALVIVIAGGWVATQHRRLSTSVRSVKERSAATPVDTPPSTTDERSARMPHQEQANSIPDIIQIVHPSGEQRITSSAESSRPGPGNNLRRIRTPHHGGDSHKESIKATAPEIIHSTTEPDLRVEKNALIEPSEN